MTARRRRVFALADQAVFALTSVAVVPVAASRTTAAEFGAFALLYGYYVLMLQLSQAAFAEPLLVQRTPAAARATLSGAAGGALLFSLAGAGTLPLLALLFQQTPLAPACIMAAALPGALLCDTLRLGLIAEGRTGSALAVDLFWGASQCVGLMAAARAGNSLSGLLLGFTASGVASATAAIAVAGVRPRPLQLRVWLRTYGTLSRSYLVEVLALATSTYATLYLLGHVAGLVAAGALRSAQTVLGPAALVANAVRVAVIVEYAKAAPGLTAAALRGRCLMTGAGLAGITALCAAAVFALPDEAGEALFGPSWSGALAVLPAMTAYRACSAAAVGPLAGLRALHQIRVVMWLRLSIAVLLPVGAVVGAKWAGAVGGTWGMAAVTAAELVGYTGALMLVPVTVSAEEPADRRSGVRDLPPQASAATTYARPPEGSAVQE
ncbi:MULTISPECIES: hypothetical protein [Streptomyces]|uniref:hypothetical protein n=1 Tax=Streptomyces TaxID=1883 RepID=UPI001489D0C3|nr:MULTISPECIES: hypothetical protein [Streptomyces]